MLVLMLLLPKQIPESDRKMFQLKFSHFVARHKLAFTNYPALCQLEAKHGAYCNPNAGKTFCHLVEKLTPDRWIN